MRRLATLFVLLAVPAQAWTRKSLFQVVPGSPFTGGGGGGITYPLLAPSGTAGAPSYSFSSAATTGFFLISNRMAWVSGGVAKVFYDATATTVSIGSDWQLGWSNNVDATAANADIGFARYAANVLRVTNGGTAIRGLLGGGTTVASATAMPLPTGNVFHVSGVTDITSITSTNFASGACITLIFDGVLNFTDGNNLKLASTMATTADDTISLCYDGTNWFETARSVN